MKSLKKIVSKSNNFKLKNKNTYSEEISRNQPTAFVFMIDQSGSMNWNSQNYQGKQMKYAEIVAEMLNSLLNELINRCTKQGGIRDYFHISVLGYGGIDDRTAYSIWEGKLKGRDWVSVSEIKENCEFELKIINKNIKGKIKVQERKDPYWIKPVGNYGTPMGAAFEKAYELLNEWIQKDNHKDSFPPVVINITDGAQTDCLDEELIAKAEMLKSLNTTDGNILVLNCHISNSGSPIFFPINSSELPYDNNYAQRLYEMSSEMPEVYNSNISIYRKDGDISSIYRGMAFNGSVEEILNMLNIGTTGTTPNYITK